MELKWPFAVRWKLTETLSQLHSKSGLKLIHLRKWEQGIWCKQNKIPETWSPKDWNNWGHHVTLNNGVLLYCIWPVVQGLPMRQLSVTNDLLSLCKGNNFTITHVVLFIHLDSSGVSCLLSNIIELGRTSLVVHKAPKNSNISFQKSWTSYSK